MSGKRTGRASMTWAEVCARRLERHALLVSLKEARPAEIVSAMCGAHAQVMSAAELSIGLRIAGITRQEIQDAIWSERSLVKTFGPRGTVHLLPTQELPMWTGALSALPSNRTGLAEAARMTPEQTEAVIEAIAAALEDAELTTDELTEAIVTATGPWAGDLVLPAFQGMWARWRQAVGVAASRGALCFGPNRGRDVTYTSPRRWLPGFRPSNGQSALNELVRHFLHAYGPAAPQQFAQWLAAPRRWAAELFDSLAGELEEVEVDGAPAWVAAGDTAAPATPASGLRLLPYFDAYVVGCHPREQVFPGRAAERALPGGQAGVYPTLLIGGVVAGIWRQRRSGKKLHLTVEPFGRLSAAQRRELDQQVGRMGEFLEGTPELTIGAVTIGGHA